MGAAWAFDVEGKGGVFDLDGVDVGDFAGATEGGGADFGKADILDLALTIIGCC